MSYTRLKWICHAQATLESIRRTRLALKGPLKTPSGGGYRSSNVRLREAFLLYANLRPAKTIIPGGRFDNIDLVVAVVFQSLVDLFGMMCHLWWPQRHLFRSERANSSAAA